MNAQQAEVDNSFGGWHFVEVDHKFGDSKWSGMLYFEHENFQYQRLDCWYIRPGVRYGLLPWLKLGLSYDYLKVPSTYGHRAVIDMVGTLKEGNLSAALRMRYLHTWKPELGTEDNEMRTRLIVSYKIPETRFIPYLAVEIFTWGGEWRKSRHYAACTYDITDFMQVEGFYMLTFRSKDPEHIMGLGMNFTL
jgi:hypothetical protein